MKLTAPYIQTLRTRFAEYCQGRRSEPGTPRPLREIMLVGARIRQDGALASNDHSYLERALLTLSTLDVRVSPRFNVSLINLEPEYGGEDFLSGAYKADLLMLCYLFNPPEPEEDSFGDFMVSPHHFNPGIWQSMACRSGAKIIVPIGDDSEINARNFEGPVFRRIKTDSAPFSVLAEKNYAVAAKLQPLKP